MTPQSARGRAGRVEANCRDQTLPYSRATSLPIAGTAATITMAWICGETAPAECGGQVDPIIRTAVRLK